MSESISMGATLCDIRKRRGLSQKALSEASGVPISLIRKLEQEQLDHTRLETAHKLATALRVPTTQLFDRRESPEGADPDASPDAEVWAPVRHAVERPPTDTATEAPTLEGVQAAADAVGRAWATNQLATAATLLPPALRDAEALGDEGREAYAYVLHLAGSLLTQTRHTTLPRRRFGEPWTPPKGGIEVPPSPEPCAGWRSGKASWRRLVRSRRDGRTTSSRG